MGPTLSVYLPQALPRAEIEALSRWLERTKRDVTRFGDSWEFWFSSTSCLCSLAMVPFGAESAGRGEVTAIYWEEDQFIEFELLSGYRPAIGFQLDNYCRDDKWGHGQLADLSANLARSYHGLIDVGSAVHTLATQVRLKRQVALPGRCIALDLLEPTGFGSYLVDADFMEAWMQHPNFHLEI